MLLFKLLKGLNPPESSLQLKNNNIYKFYAQKNMLLYALQLTFLEHFVA